MPRKPKLTHEQLAYAAESLARGRGTKASIAAELGISAPGLGGALRRYEAERAPEKTFETSASLEQPADVADVLESGAEALTKEEQKAFYTRIIKKCERDYAQLADAGETAEARKVLDLAIKASTALQRLERKEDGDLLSISREELDERRERVRKTITTYLETKRPLLCHHCNRELGVRWGKGDE